MATSITKFKWKLGFRGCIGTRIFTNFSLCCIAIGCGQLVIPYGKASEAQKPKQTIDREDQRYYANAHTYLDDPNERIVSQIPELKSFRPATNQDDLPAILDKTGDTVSEFLHNVVNVVAREKILEQKFTNPGGDRQEVDDDYLILRRGSDIKGDIEECRVDAHGERMDQVGFDRGFFVTSNFALSAIYFSAEQRANSRFRYLGDQKWGGRDAFVVGFAQEPGHASISTSVQGMWNGSPYLVHMLLQGVAWIDKSDYRILRMRTDLLAPRRDIGLLRLTTLLDYAAENVAGGTSPLWLIHQVKIYAHFSHVVLTSAGISIFNSVFRNDHLLSDYRRYGVNATVGGESVTPAQSDSDPDKSSGSGDSYVKVPAQIANEVAATYVEAPLEVMVKELPVLKSLRPTASQKLLPAILQKTGARVDELFANIVDLTARENIMQARLDHDARVIASHNTQGNYLIVHRKGSKGLNIEEYRTDSNGNRSNGQGLDSNGYFVTSGFALDSNYFSTAFQEESAFRYLGTQKIGGREANVVAFAQNPSKATLTVAFRERDGTGVAMFVQGIAWIDEGTSQVLRLRTDLLAPLYAIGVDRLTTEMNLSEVRLQDVTTPLWLPKEVSVRIFMNEYSYENADYYEQIYENRHHYANFQRFRVGVKVGP